MNSILVLKRLKECYTFIPDEYDRGLEQTVCGSVVISGIVHKCKCVRKDALSQLFMS